MNALPSLITTFGDVPSAPVAMLLMKLTGLLAGAWLLHAALAACNPRWRVLVWRCQAGGVVLMTALALRPPLVQLPVLPARVPAALESRPERRIEALTVDVPSRGGPGAMRSDVPSTPVVSHQVHDGNATAPTSEFLVPAGRSTGYSSSPAAVAPPTNDVIIVAQDEPIRRSLGVPAWLAAGWCGGMMLGAVWTLLGLMRLTGIRRRATPVPDWIVPMADEAAARLGILRPVELRQTADVQSPCLVGLLHPLVLLPERQCQLAHQDELPSIFAHELAHLKGGDLFWNMTLNWLSTLLWFHPLMWLVRRTHADACDGVADAVAADYVGDAAVYGRTLARLTLRIAVPEVVVGLAMAKKSGVQRRIEAIRGRVFRDGLPRFRAAAAVLLAAAATVTLGGLALSRSNAAPPKDRSTKVPDNSKPAEKSADGEKRKPARDEGRPEKKTEKKPDAARDKMTIRAVAEATGEPIAGVEIKFNGWIDGRIDLTIETDESGVAEFDWKTGAKVRNLWFTASAPRFVPINYNWRSERREIELQNEIELRFESGQEIGGIVQDESGRPIADAKIELRLPNTWPRLDHWVFTAGEFRTNKDGRWKFDGAPADPSQLGVSVSHEDYISSGSGAKKGFDNVAVLKQGLTVTGRVVDAKGEPIQGAKAQLGMDRFGSGEPTATTDADGRYVIKKCKPGPSLVTVQADGFAPQFKPLTIGDKNEGYDFKLEKGRTLRVRIVDVDGKPLPGATLAADTWRGYRSLDFRGSADAAGEIAWTSAPEDAVLCDLLKQGYMSVRKVALRAGEDVQVVKLPPPLVISGRVTDATTGEPIDKFQLREGSHYDGSSQIYWSRDKGLDFDKGEFTVRYTEPTKGHILQAIAPGYLPLNSRVFASTDGKQTFDFALKRGAGPSGIVLLPDGTPVAGAEVVLATREKRASLEMGRVSRQSGAEVTKTDAEGRFSFLPQDGGAFALIVLHDAGYAELSSAEFEKSNRIALVPWGRISGRMFEGDVPDANRAVALYPTSTDARRPIFEFVSYSDRATTDGDGRFIFDRVIPGKNVISRVLVIDFGRGSTHHYGWNTAVEVPAGKTADVTIGGKGRPVVGRLVLDGQPEHPVDWSIEPVSIGPSRKVQVGQDDITPRYVGRVLKSGRFRVTDVPAGDYMLAMSLKTSVGSRWPGEGIEVATARVEFTIPEIPGGRSDAPFDLGDIKATVLDTLDVGESAPDFVAEDVAGGMLRMSSLRGKLLVVNFWESNHAESVADMQALKRTQEKFGANPRFALLSLGCNSDAGATKKHVEQNGYAWRNAIIGPMYGARVTKQYMVRSLPAVFLIGPDSRVLAKNVRGEALDKAIAASLADEKLFAAAADSKPAARFPLTRFEKLAAAPPLKAPPAVLVLDDTDPNFETDQPRDDRLRLLSVDGRELWSHTGFNACQSVGAMHGVAVDRKRGRFYVRENVAHRITSFTVEGQKLWQVDSIDVDSLAIDEQTGNIWCSGGPLLNQGETVVFGPEGAEVAAYPYRAIDLAYDPRDGAFWMAGYEILKVNRQGEVLFRKKVDGWCCASVAVNPVDGSVWIAERAHSDRADSRNRLWLLNADGSIRRTIEMGERNLFVVAFDRKAGDAWIGGSKTGMRRIPASGEPGEPLAIEARNISISPTTGDLWVTTEEAVLRLDAAGKVLARFPFHKPSGQSWLKAF